MKVTVAGILAKAGEGILRGAGDVLDKLFTNKEEKGLILLELEKVINARLSETEATLRHRNEMTVRVIEAEMAQGDKWTKRARPSIIYVGLLIAFCQMVVMPTMLILQFITPEDAEVYKTYGSHELFWGAWAAVAGIYSWGRSQEKKTTRAALMGAVADGGGSPQERMNAVLK